MYIIRSSGFFLVIDQIISSCMYYRDIWIFFNNWSRFSKILLPVPPGTFLAVTYLGLDESFFWYAIQNWVPSDYNFLFASLYRWLVCILIPNTYVAYFFVFRFYYCHYWSLGSLSFLLSLKFQILWFFPSKENL